MRWRKGGTAPTRGPNPRRHLVIANNSNPSSLGRTLFAQGVGLVVVVTLVLGLVAVGSSGRSTEGSLGSAPKVAEVAPSSAAPEVATDDSATTVDISQAQTIGSWTYYGYKLNRSETDAIANISLWSAARGVSSSRLIPYSGPIMSIYSVNWVLTARNARSMGQCLAISYAGVGLIVGC